MRTGASAPASGYHAAPHGGEPTMLWRNSDTWQTAIDDWTMWLQAGHKSDATVYQRRWQIRRLAEHHAGRSPWRLTLDDLTRWLTSQGWGPETTKSTASALRSFYSWAVATGRTKRDPAAKLPEVKVRRRLPRPATDRVYDRALDGADDKVRLMILLGALAGLRAAEIARLRWDSIDGTHLVIRGKGQVERRIPMHPHLEAALVDELGRRHAGGIGSGFRYPHDGDVWVFPGQSDGGMHPGYVSHILSKALGAATGHQLRHRFATGCLAVEGNLRTVQKLLGHASPDTTAIYTDVTDQTLTRTVNAL